MYHRATLQNGWWTLDRSKRVCDHVVTPINRLLEPGMIVHNADCDVELLIVGPALRPGEEYAAIAFPSFDGKAMAYDIRREDLHHIANVPLRHIMMEKPSA